MNNNIHVILIFIDNKMTFIVYPPIADGLFPPTGAKCNTLTANSFNCKQFIFPDWYCDFSYIQFNS